MRPRSTHRDMNKNLIKEKYFKEKSDQESNAYWVVI